MFISMLISPAFYLLCLAILTIFLKNKRWKIACGIATVSLFLLFSNGPLYQFAAEQWYKEYDHPLPERKTYTYGIVLGGYSHWDWKRERAEFSGIADRLLEGIRLYKQGRIRKLVLASHGSIIQRPDGKGWEGNPEGMMQFLKAMGMPEEDVILETRANNTWENATFTLKLIGDSLKTEPCLLITSATHMRRSLFTFQAVGLHPDAYITDTFVRLKGVKPDYLPSLFVLASWPEMTHEWVGYIVYKLRNK